MKTETEPKQTAMQRLIDEMKMSTVKVYGEKALSFEYFLKFAESLLPEERKEIEEAYMDGKVIKHMRTKVDIESATEYYQTKFKQ